MLRSPNLKSISTHYVDMKGNAYYKQQVVRGSSGSPKVTRHNTIRQNAYNFVLVIYSSYDPILQHFGDLTRYWSKISDFNLPPLYLSLRLGMTLLEFRTDLWRHKTRVRVLLYDVDSVIPCLAVLEQPQHIWLGTQLPTYIKQRDGQTHSSTAYTALA